MVAPCRAECAGGAFTRASGGRDDLSPTSERADGASAANAPERMRTPHAPQAGWMPRPIPRLLAPVLATALLVPAIPVVDRAEARRPAVIVAREAGSGHWLWPVDPPRAILRPFLAPATAYGPGHRGIDIRAPGGVLLAPDDATVRFAGVVVDRPVLSLDHGDGVVSSFEPVAASVGRGDRVQRGQPIGRIVPGHCPEACVHVGVRVDGAYVSPLLFFGGLARSVLLPTRRGRRLPEKPDGECGDDPARRSRSTDVRRRPWFEPRRRRRSRDPATRTARR